MSITPNGQAALIAAADWLTTNPDKHVQGKLRDGNGCYCAVGRLAVESGCEEASGDRYLSNVADATGLTLGELNAIWKTNDGFPIDGVNTNRPEAADCKADAIAMMRALAA